MDQQRVEEYDVTFLHFQIEPLPRDLLVLLYAEVGLVHFSVPVGVNMIKKPTFVGFWQNVQRPVLFSSVLKRCPSSNDLLCRTEWEVCEILVERMPRTSAHSGRLVDEHSVH